MTAQQANWDQSLLPQQPGGETKQSANTHPGRPAGSRVPDVHFCTQPARQPEHPGKTQNCTRLPAVATHTRQGLGWLSGARHTPCCDGMGHCRQPKAVI